MKLSFTYRTILLCAISCALPLMLMAGKKRVINKVAVYTLNRDSSLFAVSIQDEREEKGQDKKQKDKKPEDKRENPPGDRQKPTIKEVPRSIPKLKPKAVTDRIPIKRLPVRIPKKGIRIIRF